MHNARGKMEATFKNKNVRKRLRSRECHTVDREITSFPKCNNYSNNDNGKESGKKRGDTYFSHEKSTLVDHPTVVAYLSAGDGSLS